MKRIALHARYFNQTADRIANQSQDIFKSQRDRVIHLLGRAVAQFDTGRAGHGDRRSAFRLTTADGTGNHRIFRNDITDARGRKQGAQNIIITAAQTFRQRQQDRRQNAARTRGRTRHNAAHFRVSFRDAHTERGRAPGVTV